MNDPIFIGERYIEICQILAIGREGLFIRLDRQFAGAVCRTQSGSTDLTTILIVADCFQYAGLIDYRERGSIALQFFSATVFLPSWLGQLQLSQASVLR